MDHSDLIERKLIMAKMPFVIRRVKGSRKVLPLDSISVAHKGGSDLTAHLAREDGV